MFIFVATIPSGITESTTTQSDWVAALWPILALALAVGRARRLIPLAPYVVLLGVATALTMGTKPTAALATGLVLVLAAWWELRPPDESMVVLPMRDRFTGGLTLAAMFIIGSLVGGLPQVLRNLTTTGSALGVKTDIFVEHPSLAIMWGNTVRTLVNNVGVPPPLSDPINARLPDLLAILGIPWTDSDAIHLSNVLQVGLGRNEDVTTNPVHLVIGFAVAVVVTCLPGTPRMLRYVVGLSVVFFVVTNGLLQWQIWSTRFFLPAMAMFCLPLAWLADRWLQSSARPNVRGVVAGAIIMATSLYGLAVSVAQEYRPLIGPGSVLTTPREDQYFRVINRPGAPDTPQAVLMSRIDALSVLPAGSTIGLYKFYGQEYLVWRMLNPDGRYTFVNLQGLDGDLVVDPTAVDGTICERECSPTP